MPPMANKTKGSPRPAGRGETPTALLKANLWFYGGRSGDARRSRRAMLGLLLGWTVLATPSHADPEENIWDVAKTCHDKTLSFENVVTSLQNQGWRVLAEEERNHAINALGDAFLNSGQFAKDREDLLRIRQRHRSGMGAKVNRRESSFFSSRTLTNAKMSNAFVNVHWQARPPRMMCSAGFLSASESPVLRSYVLSLTENSGTNDFGAFRFTNSDIGQARDRTTLFEHNATAFNQELDEPMLANIGISIVTTREEQP